MYILYIEQGRSKAYMCLHRCMCIYTHTHTHIVQSRSKSFIYIHTSTGVKHLYTHTYTHTYIYTCMFFKYIYTCVYMCIICNAGVQEEYRVYFCNSSRSRAGLKHVFICNYIYIRKQELSIHSLHPGFIYICQRGCVPVYVNEASK